MKHHLSVLLGAATLLGLAPTWASAVGPGVDPSLDARSPLGKRATHQSPKGYEPSFVDCPAERPTLRRGSALGPEEREWLPRRRKNTIAPIRDFLRRADIPGFDSAAYLANVEHDPTALPNVGLALSGGGYRAMLFVAGALAAWDDRSPGSTDPGNMGGMLQCATYFSCVSGGCWASDSMVVNNFSTVGSALESAKIWKLQHSVLKGPEQYSLLSYYKEVFETVLRKKAAGFEISLTDLWSRMLAFQLIDADYGGPSLTWSSIANDPTFALGEMPLPITLAISRDPGYKDIAYNSTVIEITPWEIGSSSPSINGWAPLKYVGSKFRNGSLQHNESCVIGYDNVGFVLGTTSSLFNQVLLYLTKGATPSFVPDGVPDFAVKIVADIIRFLDKKNEDVAKWHPNPFLGWNPDSNPTAGSETLSLVDGGEDDEVVPYNPLIQEDRHVDVIFSIDSAANTNSFWPDGTSLVTSFERIREESASGTGFAYVPGQDTIVNLGINRQPTFFACHSTNTSGVSPFVVYIPNYPYYYHSNISTVQIVTEEDERDAIISNSWAVVTQANSTRDPQWPVCIGCAMLARSFERTNTALPDACAKCFDRYCWNGTLAEHEPELYDPPYLGTPIKTKKSGAAAGAISLEL